ncbi:MAG: SRPBCC family protein [Pseudomonadales bacterium]
MEQTGEHRIAASRDTVWAALNDPDILCRSLDGCQSMNKTADDRFDAVVKAKVGPVSATFNAELELHDVLPPERYTIHANVKGGPAGFARGQAQVNLIEDGDATVLQYAVKASVGGKLAQVGSRLIDGTARKMAEGFFSRFTREVGGEVPGEEATGAAQAAPRASRGSHAQRDGGYETGGAWKIWVIVFVALALALLFAL